MSRAQRHFTVGAFTFCFEESTGFIRNIAFQGREVLCGIYPAVRDRDWLTLHSEMKPLRVAETADSLQLLLEGRVTAPEIDLTWKAVIDARAAGTLRYHWQGRAMRECTTNRAGLCVLHAAELAGAPCVVEHVDGSRESGWFPENISPHQPFRDIRAITHVMGRRSLLEVRMLGGTFEMEDQRNWTDPSFKTYGRPLAWPHPYVLAPGEEIDQSVTVEIRGDREFWPTTDSTPPTNGDRLEKRMPRVGFTLPGSLPVGLRDRCRLLRPAHIRVETDMTRLAHDLEWALAESASLDCVLLLAIRGATKEPPERSAFPSDCVVQLFDDNGNTVASETLAAWEQAGFADLATGTLNHFADLNRNRPPVDGGHDYTVFGVNAQVHASDDRSIEETLSQHGAVARAAHRFGAGRLVIVSPISLGRGADSVDPRLLTMFGARWLWESLNQLSDAGCVEAATYFHTHGPAGFMSEDRITPVEQLLRKIAGSVTLPTVFPLSA